MTFSFGAFSFFFFFFWVLPFVNETIPVCISAFGMRGKREQSLGMTRQIGIADRRAKQDCV